MQSTWWRPERNSHVTSGKFPSTTSRKCNGSDRGRRGQFSWESGGGRMWQSKRSGPNMIRISNISKTWITSTSSNLCESSYCNLLSQIMWFKKVLPLILVHPKWKIKLIFRGYEFSRLRISEVEISLGSQQFFTDARNHRRLNIMKISNKIRITIINFSFLQGRVFAVSLLLSCDGVLPVWAVIWRPTQR